MAVLSDYTSGMISLANGSATVTGTGTLFEVTRFREGDTLQIQNLTAIIASVDSDTQLTLSEPWTGTNIVDGPYRARQLGDGSRVSTQAATIIELLGNGVLTNLAELGVEEGKVPVGGPTGEYELVDPDTFGIQDPNGNLGKLAALEFVANKVFITNGTSDPILATIAEVLGYTPANKAGETFTGNVTIAPTGGNGQVQVSIDGTNYNWFNSTQLALRNNTTGAYSYLNGSDVWLMRNGGIQMDGGSLSLYGGTILVRTAGTGTKVRWGTNDTTLSALGVEASGSGQVALYGAAGTSYLSGDGNNLLRGSSYQISRGNLSVSGSLSKGSGTFLIDHPLDPFNRNLRHGFVEAPRYDLIYRGTVRLVDGRATVDIDAASNMSAGTFEVLTTNAVVTSLQDQEGFARLKPSPITDGSFEIICEDETCTDLVSWVVIAERDDPFVKSGLEPNTDNDGRFVPEFDKPEYAETENA